VDRSAASEKRLPVRTSAPLSTAFASVRWFAVPIWSSSPNRPQLRGPGVADDLATLVGAIRGGSQPAKEPRGFLRTGTECSRRPVR
jgi:hypothetical protein